jgi:hypothetical protein
MIHISIPSTVEKCERFEDNKKYQVYNINLNGAYHSRYVTNFILLFYCTVLKQTPWFHQIQEIFLVVEF